MQLELRSKLQCCKTRVQAVGSNELVVASDLDDASVIEDDDAVGALHGRQPMRNHHRRTSCHGCLQCALHDLLAFGIERAGRFVEQQQRRILQHGTRNRDALALPAGQAHAAFAKEAAIAVGKRADEIIGERRTRGRNHLVVGRRRPAITNVFHCVGGEDHRVLRHQGNACTHVVEPCFGEGDAVEQDRTCAGVIEAQQQLKNGGLAGTGRSDQCHGFARVRSKAKNHRALNEPAGTDNET